MNVMAIGAHPDDIEFGCSGTLIKHKERGDTVVYVCMTSTESKSGTSGNILRSLEQLKSEVKCSTELIECDYVEFAPFSDLHVPFNFETASIISNTSARATLHLRIHFLYRLIFVVLKVPIIATWPFQFVIIGNPVLLSAKLNTVKFRYM